MRVVFANAFKTLNPFMWITALWTRGKYYHCEFLFDDDMMYGASFTDRHCRWMKFDDKRDDYDVFDVVFKDEDVELIKKMCEKYNGKRYDYMGLFGFVFKSDSFDHKNKYFCSEIMSHILNECTEFQSSKRTFRTSPNKLINNLKPYIKKEEL